MYVCICNAFTCKDVKRLKSEGVEKSGQVYKKLGCKMQCGKCLDTIETLLKDDVDIDKLNAKKIESINSLSVSV